MGVEIVNWKAFERGTLQGFADIRLPTVKLTLYGCAVHQKNGRRWVQTPSKPQLDADRNLVKDEQGKIQYWPAAKFDDRDVGDRFSEAALAALDAHLVADKPKGDPGLPDDEIPF